jgi:hypothetical protein
MLECFGQKKKQKKSNLGIRECLLLLGAESFVFQMAIQKFKDQDI